MKTLFLGVIILLLPNLLDACNSDPDTEEYTKCFDDCRDYIAGRMIHVVNRWFNGNDICRKHCEHLNRYVYFEHLRKPEIFLLLKLLTAPTLEDIYLLKVFSDN